MNRKLVVTLQRGDTFHIDDYELERLFAEHNIPFPAINKAVLSKEFRKAVSEYGLTLLVVDDKDLGVLEYIPPGQIVNMKFYISDAKVKPAEIMERERKGKHNAYLRI